MTLPKLLYLTFQGLETYSGYAIQFLSEAEGLIHRGYPLHVLTFPDWRTVRQKSERFQHLEEKHKSLGAGFTVRPVIGEYRWASRKLLDVWLARYIRKLVHKQNIDIVHAHGFDAGYLVEKALRNSRIPTVLDLHGAYFWEKVNELGRSKLSLRDMSRARYHKQKMIDFADRIFCVSEYFRSYINDVYFASSEKIILTPSGVDVKPLPAKSERETLRKQLGLAGKFVLVYAGSTHRWQKIDDVFQLAGIMQKLIPKFHLLVLSRSAKQMEQIADEHSFPLDKLTVKSLSHDQMHIHLAAADVSVLLRENNLVNKVASPIKFAEYLAAGLPVILTDCIGDTAALIHEQEVGYLIHQLDLPTYEQVTRQVQQTNFTQELRERCNQAAAQVYDWSVILDTFDSQYEQLMSGITEKS